MRARTFQYNWCDKTETDYVCERCETIVLDLANGCQHCGMTKTEAPTVGKIKGVQTSIELNRIGELELF